MADIKVLGPPDCDDDDSCDDDDERGKRGHRGHRGHRGDAGPTGPTGPTGSSGTAINLLKFSGLATVVSEGIPLTSYLADTGTFVGSDPLSIPPNYPVPIAFDVGSFATNVLTDLSVPPGGFILFELVKNAGQLGEVVVATITYIAGDASGIKTTTFAPAAFAVGDTIDVRVTPSVGLVVASSISVSAMVGS